MKRIFILLLTLAALLLADDDRYERHGYHLPKDLRHLDLSKEQHDAVKTALQRYRDGKISLRRDRYETMEKIEALFGEEVFDRSRFVALRMAHEKAQSELESRLLADMHALLTPQQRQRFLYYIDEWIEP